MGLLDGLIKSGKTPTIQDYYKDIQAPETADMELELQRLVQQGIITPEDAQAALVGDSAMSGISLDPRMEAAQMDALSGLQDISDNGGMTLIDEANLRKIQSQEQTQARGAREAILQNAQSRGMGGSGLELMSQMQNQQDSATRASARDTDVAAQAQARALEALMQGGTMAGNMRSQSFGEKSAVAGAQDAISKFNAQNQQSVNMANTAARNNAQAANLTAKQNVADANVGLGNQQQQYNKELKQKNYENQLNKAAGQTGVAGQNAANQGAQSQARANATNQLVGGLIGAGSAYLGKKKNGGIVFGGTDGETDDVPHLLAKGEMVIPAHRVADVMTKAHTDNDGNFDASGFLDEILGNPKKGKK